LSQTITIAVTNGTHDTIKLEKEILQPWQIDYVTGDCKTEEETIQLCKDADIILTTSAPLTAKVIKNLPQCKMILRYGIGVDNIDLEAASSLQIPVVNVPDYGVVVVAEHTVALLLASVRKIPQVVQHVKNRNWDYPDLAPMYELQGKTLGLAGFGNIARAVAKRMKAFDMRVIAYDPYISEDVFVQHSVENANWGKVLAESDVVSVHLPLTPATQHWIGREALQKMKASAYLINTSRGGVVDTDALVEALGEGSIAGAALDVLEKEPPPADHPLHAFDPCIITSHCAHYSEESSRRLHEYAGLEVARFLRGERPKHIVNRVEPILTPVLKIGGYNHDKS